MNKFALALGGVLLVALVLLCFRLAYDGMKTGVANKGYTTNETRGDTDDVYTGPRAPAGSTNSPQIVPRTTTPPVTSAPVNPVVPPPPMPTGAQQTFAMSDVERERITGLLADCRAAYDASGEVSQKWFETAGTAKAIQRLNAENGTVANAEPDTTARPLTTKEWNPIDTQIEGIAATVALATQPARYPTALQETSTGLRREMQTYLQTARTALVQSDPQKRSEIQARADTHRQKAGELLSALEWAVKTGAVPARD